MTLSTFAFIVYADGSICLDILQNKWSPTYDVSAILTSIQVCETFLSQLPPPLYLSILAIELSLLILSAMFVSYLFILLSSLLLF